MSDMPRQRLPHLHSEITRHGTRVWYVRIGKGPRIRVRGAYGSPEFQAAYDAAVAGKEAAPKQATGTTSLAWLIAHYRDSAAWAKLSPATKRQRENIFLHVIASAGQQPFAKITRKTIVAGIDRRGKTPFAAANFLLTMRGLFKWAANAELVRADPTDGVVAARPRTEGFRGLD
jgi:hypothetical protein